MTLFMLEFNLLSATTGVEQVVHRAAQSLGHDPVHGATDVFPPAPFAWHLPLLTFLFALALTPLVRKLAIRLNVVDQPDGNRKLQANSIPLAGGVSVLLSCLAAMGTMAWLDLPGSEVFSRYPRFTVGMLASSGFICLVGVLDDRWRLRGRQKLAGQVLAILILIWGGLEIRQLEVFGWEINLGLLAVPFTLFWLLGAINALNLIDGVDGLATSVGIIMSVTIAMMAWMTNHAMDAYCALALAGALAGFLYFNLPPARVYLGDAGSMLIGLVLGVLAIRSSLKGPATVAMVAPTAIWSILIFDVGMAILRRKLTGQSVYATDRAHFHHLLQKRGYSARRVVLTIGLLCTVCAVAALSSVYWKSEWMAVGSAGAVIATLVVSGFFGHSECRLLLQRVQSLAVSLGRLPRQERPAPEPVCSRFHGDREWERLWEALVQFANRFDVCIVQLNVSSPAIGEEYHALWERKVHPPLQRLWKTEIPLYMGPVTVGRLTLSGAVQEGSVVRWMAELIDGLAPFEEELIQLVTQEKVAAPAAVAVRGSVVKTQEALG